MATGDSAYRNTLNKIAEMAQSAAEGMPTGNGEGAAVGRGAVPESCVLKTLPPRLLLKAAETAAQVNHLNAPHLTGANGMPRTNAGPAPVQRLAVQTAKYWGPAARQLTVSFMEKTPTELQDRIVAHMNAWAHTTCVSFVRTSGAGHVRISRGPGGYYSYLGTDILLIPQDKQTMNLEGFTMETPEEEYKRVVRHETGHTLGFPHEHMRSGIIARIDREKAYVWFLETYGWPPAMVDAQVLTPLEEASLLGTPADQTSIMCYQLPAAITTDGQPIAGGLDINLTDYVFAGIIYPKFALQTTPPSADDWDAKKDVAMPDVAAGLVAQGGRVPAGV